MKLLNMFAIEINLTDHLYSQFALLIGKLPGK